MSTLARASRGYLDGCSYTLSRASNGYLNICIDEIIIEPPVVTKPHRSGTSNYAALTKKELEYQQQLRERILREEKEILIIIRAFLTTI